jgi:hypothetical protein
MLPYDIGLGRSGCLARSLLPWAGVRGRNLRVCEPIAPKVFSLLHHILEPTPNLITTHIHILRHRVTNPL